MSSLTKRQIPGNTTISSFHQQSIFQDGNLSISSEVNPSEEQIVNENDKKPPCETQSWSAYLLPAVVYLIFISGFILVFGMLIPYGFDSWPPRILHGTIGFVEFIFVMYAFWKGVTVNPGLVQPTWDRVSELASEEIVTIRQDSPQTHHSIDSGSFGSQSFANSNPYPQMNSTVTSGFSLHMENNNANYVKTPPESRVSFHPTGFSKPMTSMERRKLLMLEPNHDKSPRYCDKCKCFKPPRSHHSTFYGRCVLKYDHYCVWLNNTIGHFNYRYFFLFLLYTVTIWIHFIIGAGYILLSMAINGTVEDHPFLFIITVMFAIIMIPMGFLVGMFFFWHVWLLITNQTSVEKTINADTIAKMEKAKRKFLEMDHRVRFENIYSTTLYNNIATSLGKDWKKWFIPLFHVDLGDGIRFHTISHSKIVALQDYLYSISAIPKDDDDLYDDYDDIEDIVADEYV